MARLRSLSPFKNLKEFKIIRGQGGPAHHEHDRERGHQTPRVGHDLFVRNPEVGPPSPEVPKAPQLLAWLARQLRGLVQPSSDSVSDLLQQRDVDRPEIV